MSADAGFQVTRSADYMAVEFGGCNSSELSQIYCLFADLCVRWHVHSALLKAGDDQPEGHRGLRDALRSIGDTGGIPWDFKLALVPGTPRIEAVYRETQRELRLAGLNAWVFDSAAEAVDWLEGRAVGGLMAS
jgi:hypothetical protein